MSRTTSQPKSCVNIVRSTSQYLGQIEVWQSARSAITLHHSPFEANSAGSWDGLVNRVAIPRWVKEVFWNLVCYLVVLGPLSDCVEVLAHVSGVEIHVAFRAIWGGAMWIEPDLAEHTNIDSTHKPLTDDIKAVRYRTVVSIQSLKWRGVSFPLIWAFVAVVREVEEES